MKFRKKPIVIDAEQWFENMGEAVGVYLQTEEMLYEMGMRFVKPVKSKYVINTLEGTYDVIDGDWIITGIKGEKYPCKPDIFEQTYEEVLN